MAQDMTLGANPAADGWLARNKWGISIFTAGTPLVWWMARPTGPMVRYLEQMQQAQFGSALALTLLGACIGGFGMVALWFLRRKPDIAAALIGLAALYATLTPGIGAYVAPVGFVASLLGTAGVVSRWLYRRIAAKSVTFGTAEWADLEHIADKGLLNGRGVFLGKYGDRYLQYEGDKSMLTVGPPRSLKGAGAIIPNLLTYSGSVMVIDPKGENAMMSLVARAKMGQAFHVVDPWGLVTPHFNIESARINPLDWVTAEPGDEIERAMILADAIVIPSGGENNFWDEEAKSLLTGLILYVATTDEERLLRNLSRVRDLLSQDKDGMKALFLRMTLSTNPVVVATGGRALQKDDRTLANVLASAQSHTGFLDSPCVRGALSASDFQFEDLKAQPTSIYLVIPSDRLTTFSRFLRLLIQQAITANVQDIMERPEGPVLFLLDEMPALGQLTMVEQAYTLMPGYGVLIWGFVQSLPQLDKIYGKGAETIIGACGMLQLLGSRDLRTAEYFSKLCGVTTIETWSQSISRTLGSSYATSGGSTSSTESSGTNKGEAPRALVLPDELMTMHKDYQLLLVENMNPITAQKIAWYKDPRFASLGINLRPGPAPTAPAPEANPGGGSPGAPAPETNHTPTSQEAPRAASPGA